MPFANRRLSLLLVFCCAACAPRAVLATATAAPTGTGVVASPTAELTATAGALPSATATQLPPPRVFTETFDGPAPSWTILQAGNPQPIAAPAIRDGFLVFDLTAQNQWAYALYGGPDTTDVDIQATVQTRTGGDGAAGVICRYDKAAGWYELDVYEDGVYQLLLGQWLAEGLASYTPLYREQSTAIQADENTLGLRCEGNTLTPSINGQPLRMWQDARSRLKQGKIGLAVSSFADVPLTIAFDSVKVSEP